MKKIIYLFIIFIIFSVFFSGCENQWMIDILPEKINNNDNDDDDGIEPVTFTINLNTTGLAQNGFDAVSFSSNFDNTGNKIENAVSESEIAIYYKLQGSHNNNEIEIEFGTGEGTQTKFYYTPKNTDITGTNPHLYKINPLDAVEGIINIRIYSRHSDSELLDRPANIHFTKDGKITFIPGANNNAAGVTYTYRFYKDDENTDSIGADRQFAPAPIPADPEGRYGITIPDLVTEMLTIGEGRYFVRIRAHTANPDYSEDSSQSEISTSVYVRTLTVNIIDAMGEDKVIIEDNGEKYHPDTPSEYTSTFTIKVFDGSQIKLTAEPDQFRGVTWSGDGVNGDNINKREITIGSSNIITATFGVEKEDQTTPSITGENITKNWGDGTFTLSATGGESTGNLVFNRASETGNNGVISITGNTVTITGAGTATVRVMRTGDSNYNDSSWSGTITITVNKRPLNSSGISVSVAADPARIYTGSAVTLAKSQITVTDSGATITDSDWQIKTDGYSNNINAGTNAVVTIEATTSGNYTAPVNTSTFIINKAPGKLPGSISMSSRTENSITVGTVTVSGNDQTITYNISKANNNSSFLGTWQSETTFNGLEPNTAYYVYARSEESSNYLQGVWGNGTSAGGIRVSGAIYTLSESSFTVTFVVSDNNTINAIITYDNSITNAITISRASTNQPINLTDVTGTVNWIIDTYTGTKTGSGTAPNLTINPSAIFTSPFDVGPNGLFVEVTINGKSYGTTIPVIITE